MTTPPGKEQKASPASAASRVAIVIDGDWLYYAARRLGEVVDYDSLKSALTCNFGSATTIHFFRSVDTQRRGELDFMRMLSSLGYVVHPFQLHPRRDRHGETSMVTKGLDVSLTVTALCLLAHVDTLVLLTGDSDFLPLLQSVGDQRRDLVLITLPLAARSLVEAAHKRYINLEVLLKNLSSGKGLPWSKSKQRRVLPPDDMYVEKGEHLAPYLAVRECFLSAKREITLVDPYVDEQVLQMIPLVSKTVTVTILSDRITPADFCVQVGKLRKEGYTVRVVRTQTFHDRFIGVDDRWWHSGHSFKDLGGKDSLLSRMRDDTSVRRLRARVDKALASGTEHCIQGQREDSMK